MIKKKTIVIKNNRLRKIRNNLRLILLKWLSSEWNKLYDEYEKSRSRELLRKAEELELMGRESICKCMTCGNPERDMYYNPTLRQWYCVECYHEIKRFYQQRMSGQGCIYDDFNEDFYKSFL